MTDAKIINAKSLIFRLNTNVSFWNNLAGRQPAIGKSTGWWRLAARPQQWARHRRKADRMLRPRVAAFSARGPIRQKTIVAKRYAVVAKVVGARIDVQSL